MTNAQYSQVILLNASCMQVNTSKIIPIPLFLVSFFMNRGFPWSTLATCQAFHTVILHNALTDLQDHLQHVRNFLIVSSGAEANPQDTTKLPMSQLAIKMEPVPLDQIIHPWAEHQLSKIIYLWQQHTMPGRHPQIMHRAHRWPNKTTEGWREMHLVWILNWWKQ